MAGTIKMRFQSAKADTGDATLVRASNQKDSMVVAGGVVGQLMVRTNAGDGWELIHGLAMAVHNNSGGNKVAGDVLAVDTYNAAGMANVISSNVVSSFRDFVVLLENINTGVNGLALRLGGPVTTKSTGVIAALRWVRKSATAEAVEDTGTAVAAGTAKPRDAIGFSIEAAAGGFVKLVLVDRTATQVDAADIVSGTIATARLGSGAASAATFLRGDQTWAAAGLDLESNVEFREDFLSNQAGAAANFHDQPWEDGLSPGAAHGGTTVAGLGGVIQWVTGAVVPRPVGQVTMLPFAVSKNPTLKVRQAQSGAAAATRYVGLGSANLNAAPANGIYFRHSNAGNYIGVARSGGTESTVDSAVAAADGVFHKLKAVVTGGGTNVEIFVDDVSKGNITTNIPSASLFISAGSDSAVGGTGFYLDSISVRQTR